KERKKERTKKSKHNKKKKKKELYCFQLVFIIQNITIQNKQTVFTQGQVSNLRDQCTLLKQNLSLMHLNHQFYCVFLNIEEKIYHQIVNQKEKMKKKYEIIRLITNKSKSCKQNDVLNQQRKNKK
ncbi:hypothetical protein TTHERM_002653400, partial (macronuclear) [Tetrahymena thermophila SB210]